MIKTRKAVIRSFGILFVVILIPLWCPAIVAEVKSPTVNWIRLDFPPNYILRGDNAGNGAFENVIRFFSKQLSHYDMQIVDMSRKRFWHELQSQENYCEVGAERTIERQQYAYFSIPMTLIPPAKIVLNQSVWETLGKPDRMSLSDLLSNSNLKGSMMSVRSYGYAVDSVLKKHESDINANMQNEVIELDSLYTMIAMKRLDFTIDYEILVFEFLEKHAFDNLKVVAIDEEDKYHTMHIACTKNAWGEQVIKEINGVLKQFRIEDSFRQNFSIYGESFNGEFYQRYKQELDTSQ